MKTVSVRLPRFVCYILVTAFLAATKTIAQSGATNYVQVQCPTNIVVTSCTNIQEVYAPIVTDTACSNWTVVLTPPSGSFFAPNTTNLVDCAVIDYCGVSNGCTFTVTVLLGPNCPPTNCFQVQCPTNKMVPCGTSWNFDDPIASTCCTNLIAASGVLTNLLVTPATPVTNGPCANVITQTWLITDGCGDTNTCSQTVTVVNTNAPFILCPPDITVSSCTNVQEFYAPIASAACGLTNVTVVCTPPSGSFFAPGTVTTVNCTATDCSGNMNTCSFTVTVNAQLTVSCPTNKTVLSSSNWSFDPPIASTCCSNLLASTGVLTNLLVIPISTVTNGACPQYDVTETWLIRDGCGDTTNCSQTVTVLCCVPPPPNMVLWLPFDETSGITAANLASPPDPGTHIGGPTVVLGAYVDNSLHFNGTSQYVSVPDYPAIDIGTGNLTIDAWVLREPNAGNSPPSVIVDKRDINSGAGYSLSLSYGELILTLSNNNYRDTNGTVPPDGRWHFVAVVLNQASTTPDIQFYVDTGPTGTAIPIPGNLDNTNSLWVAASPLGGNQPWLGDIDEVEVYDRALANTELAAIYNAGVAGKCKPACTGITVTCPTNKMVPCGTSWNFDDPIASTCCTNLIAASGVLTNLLVTPATPVTNGPCANVITQTWLITDGCGDTNTCSQTVTVVNTNAPFILCPPDITVSSCTNVQEFYAPIASAACGLTNVTVVCTPPSGSFFAPGTVTTVNCTATDCSGNMNTCSFTVTVNAQLTVSCPTNKTVLSSSNWSFDPPIASTCCSNLLASTGVLTNLLVIPISTVTNGACPQYDVTETWLIRDGCGDTTNCSQTVTVLCCVPPPPNMVLWLPFDETSGITAANLASPPDPGTHIGGPTVVLGAYVDNSLHFNGTSQYVSVPDYPAIDIGTGNLTIDAWVLREPNAGNSPPSVIVDKRDINSGAGYSLSLSYGELILTLSNNNYRDTNGTVPPDGRWHFVAVVLNQASTTPDIQFYVDTGPTGTAIPIPGNLDNTNSLWVAASPLGGNQPWLGDIDEVEVYDRALANTELAAIYNAGVAGKCKPACTGITVTCPTNKMVPCGTSWNFDDPIASTCCTNLIAASGVLTNLLVTPATPVTNGVCPKFVTESWQISDGCGDTATCTQQVTVVDTTPPVIACPTNTIVVNLNSNCELVIPLIQPPATDNCTPASQLIYTQSPTNGTVVSGSSQIVTVTVTDLCGNSSQCQVRVVGRYPPPVINCPGVVTVTNCVMPNVLPLVTATGCNGPIPFTFTQSPPPGTPLGPGSDTVTVTVTGLGGSDSCVIAIQFGPQMSFLNVLTNTGIALNGSLLPNSAVDPHYTLGPVPGPVSGYTVPQAVVVTNEWPSLELSPFVSQWIAPCTLAAPNLYLYDCPPGFYTYTNQFVLPVGVDASTASISGRWAADDGAVAMLFNGGPTGNSIPINYGFNHWTPFTISSNFLAYPAVNTILFVVTNAAQYGLSPTGLRVEYTNAFSGCTNCAPPAIVWMTPSAALPSGGTAVFTVNVSGTLPLTYQWYHNNVPLTPGPQYPGGVNGPTLIITPVGGADAGAYYVIVTNPCGQVQSPTRTLTVTPGWAWNWAWWNFQLPNNYLLANVGPNLLVVGPNTNLLGTGTTLDFGLPNPAYGVANVLDVPPLPANTSIQVPLIAAPGNTSDSSYTILMDLYEPDTSLGTPSTLFASIACCVSNLSSGGQDGVGLTIDAKNNLLITGSAAGVPFNTTSAAPMPANAWNRVALVVDDPQDGVAVNVSVYLNGQLVASRTVPTPVGLPINWNNSAPILLSVLSDATSLNGEIYVSSIEFHSVALDPETIAGMGSPADGSMLADNPVIVTPPEVSVSYQANGSINLSWSGNAYVLQETTNLSGGQWVDSPVPFTETIGSTGITTTAVVKPASGGPSKFYRLVFAP